MNDRKQHWEEVYTRKSAQEVSWYEAEPRRSLELIRSSGLDRQAAIIDVGGGASRLVDRLQAAGFRRLAVLDISAKALAVARQRLGDQAAAIEWFETDVTQFSAPHQFDLWHDRAAFHFLTSAMDRRRYMQVLRETLRPGGQVIIAAFALDGPSRCSDLEIVQYDAARLLAEMGPDFQIEEQVMDTHHTPSGKQQKFGYYRLRRSS